MWLLEIDNVQPQESDRGDHVARAVSPILTEGSHTCAKDYLQLLPWIYQASPIAGCATSIFNRMFYVVVFWSILGKQKIIGRILELRWSARGVLGK